MLTFLLFTSLYVAVYQAVEYKPEPEIVLGSMSVGEPYCPAPFASTEGAEINEKAVSAMECKSQGLCLSKDGKSCVKPIIWGEGLPPV